MFIKSQIKTVTETRFFYLGKMKYLKKLVKKKIVYLYIPEKNWQNWTSIFQHETALSMKIVDQLLSQGWSKQIRRWWKKPQVKDNGCARFSESVRGTGSQNIISLKLMGTLSITLMWLLFYPVSYKNSTLSIWRSREQQVFLGAINDRIPVSLISLVNE